MNGISAEIPQGLMFMSALKFLSLAIALASTAWCMVRKTTVEDEQGRKRFTPDGYVAIALAIGSFLVASSMQGLETMTKLSERRSGQIEAANRAVRDAIAESRQSRIERRQQDQITEERWARAEAQLTFLRTAAEARQRDLALARDVNQGSRDNLSKTGAALAQLNRLVHPIERFEMTIEWEMPLGDDMADLRTALQHFDSNDPRTWPAWLDRASAGSGAVIDIRPGTPFYPTPDNHPEVALLALTPNVGVGFFASTTPHQFIRPENIPDSDLYVRVSSGDAPILQYDTQSHSFIFDTATGENPNIRRNAWILSSVDLDASLMAIFVSGSSPPRRIPYNHDRFRRLQTAMRPTSVTLDYSGQSRWLTDYQVTRTDRRGIPMFTINVDGRRRIAPRSIDRLPRP